MNKHRATAADWHGGQTSALYSFASTGQRWFPIRTYKAEIKDCLNGACDAQALKLRRLYRHLKTLPRQH